MPDKRVDDRAATVREKLLALCREGELYESVPEAAAANLVECVGCAHRCRIPDGRHGVCAMRFNRGGRLLVPHGYVSGAACDPIEKKPFYHLLPGEHALSYGMLGCSFHCEFCQNWVTSQTLRDPAAHAPTRRISAERLVELAEECEAKVIASTYNEPLITSEWSKEIFSLAKARGLVTAYVSNGFATPETLTYLEPVLDAMNVDLKCFTDEHYRRLGGRLQPVLDTIRRLRETGKWVEVITLVVPGFNDSDEELRGIAEFLVSASADIPWHVTACHAAYKMDHGPASTPVSRILDAIKIGRQAGLRYVYGGNVIGLDKDESTFCHSCGSLLITRCGLACRGNYLKNGRCPDCHQAVPGIFSAA